MKKELMNFVELIERIAAAKGPYAVLSVLFGFTASHLVPIAPFLAGVFVLVICDFYTGVKAAFKRGEKVTSHGMRKSVLKLTDYALAILLTRMIEAIWFPAWGLVYYVSAFIALIEFRSNLENLSVTSGIDLVGAMDRRLGWFTKYFKAKKNQSNEG